APMPVQPRTIPVTNIFNTVLADVKDALNNIPGQAIADGSISQAKLGGLLAASIANSLRIGINNTAATGIELGGQAGVATASFIDFHSGAVTTDYDARIQSVGGTGAIGGGYMTIDAAV